MNLYKIELYDQNDPFMISGQTYSQAITIFITWWNANARFKKNEHDIQTIEKINAINVYKTTRFITEEDLPKE